MPANKKKQKRRLRRSLNRLPKEIEIYQEERVNQAFRNIFVKKGILKD